MQANASATEMLGMLHFKRGWIIALGVAQIIIGMIALGDMLAVTLISVMLVGWLLLVSAIVQVVHLVRHQVGTSAWQIFTIIVDILAGLYLVTHPAVGALTLTLVLAAFLIATGVMRFIGAMGKELPHKSWVIINAIVSTLLGIMLWIHWPWTGLWFIGFAIGFELLLRGWTWLMLGLMAKNVPPAAAPLSPA